MIQAALGFAGLTLRGLIGGRRATAAAILVLAPPFFALLAAMFGKHVDSVKLFHGFMFYFSLWFVIYLLSLIYGISMSIGEIEDGTAGYLYLSAVPKWLIVLIQMGVTTAALSAMLFVNLLLTGLAASYGRELVPNLLRVAPWLWDNIKVLTYWWLGAVPIVALLLARIWREGLGGRALAVELHGARTAADPDDLLARGRATSASAFLDHAELHARKLCFVRHELGELRRPKAPRGAA